ncbi:hypothetical protein DCAR_0728340 [Daucus carota subsp. sativus]|uniref:Uncharacterized protein n=1 Tax=Daucus carota subsp. sativus TaxID=79200 RepID=A0A161ZMQ2_DAUCS|nr:hypothetical protein DCAR_0728340 [Daucus carota subsp. sativus]
METYVLLKDLTPGRGTDFIKVRISREWEGRKPGATHATTKTYIIIDEEGTQVQAGPLQFGLIADFSKRLQLGSVYLISNYDVAVAPETYRPVAGEYSVNFHRKTNVKKIGDVPAIPMLQFNLKTFEETRARLGDVVTLMDVVGKLKDYTHIQTAKSGKKSLDIVLADKRDEIKVTSWENQAFEFLKLENEYTQPNVIVIITGTSTRLVKGETVLWSSSSTQYFFNIDHSAVTTLRESTKLENSIIPTLVPSMRSQEQQNMGNVETVTIAQLFEAQLPDGKNFIEFYTKANVIGLFPNEGWYYICCNKCGKILNDFGQCSKCSHKTKPMPVYKVTLAVKDSTADTSFVIFDRHVMKLINVSAQHLLNSDQNATPEMMPPILNNMVGRTCIFRLRLNQYNTVQHKEGFTVMEVDEVETNKLASISKIDSGEDSSEHDLDHESTEPSEHHLQKKRKNPDDEKYSDQIQPPPENTSKGFLEVEQGHDAPRHAKNGGQVPPPNSGTKGRPGNKSLRRTTT